MVAPQNAPQIKMNEIPKKISTQLSERLVKSSIIEGNPAWKSPQKTGLSFRFQSAPVMPIAKTKKASIQKPKPKAVKPAKRQNQAKQKIQHNLDGKTGRLNLFYISIFGVF